VNVPPRRKAPLRRTIEAWHLEVHVDDVRLELFGHLHSIVAAFGLFHNRDVGHPVQAAAYTLPKERVVVRYEYANGIHHALSFLCTRTSLVVWKGRSTLTRVPPRGPPAAVAFQPPFTDLSTDT
jgi:hypothetical protein